jgi:hypothetical protein
MAEARDPRPPVWTGHLPVRSSDTTTPARFSEQIGMRPVEVGEHFAVLEPRGGTHLAIRYDPEHVAPGPAPWDLVVEDLDAIPDTWQAEGLPVTPIVEGPPHRSFAVTDPGPLRPRRPRQPRGRPRVAIPSRGDGAERCTSH